MERPMTRPSSISEKSESWTTAEQLFHHVYSGPSSLRRVYFEPEISLSL